MFKPASRAFALLLLSAAPALQAQNQPIDVTLIRWPYT